ncbi:hypothetical protein FGG08_003487 [Glutinoglossum americanum]|uniref:Uncharacterized protein n=1 Tax=Glutinoglossum americanum TaxID=1670608 RepID=A0A9P8I783_9PEZI|nr:hypothetical protein FGG08_003487 [Glutinoglossum americanum]
MVLLTMTPAIVTAIHESRQLAPDLSTGSGEQGAEAHVSRLSLDHPQVGNPISHSQTKPGPIAGSFSTSRPSPRDSPIATEDTEDEITYADVNRQLTLVLNILLSIVACSVAIWLASSSWSTPKRLGLSMGGSGIVGVAEVVVYAGYLRRLKDAKEKVKREVERKEVVKTWVVGGESAEGKRFGKKNVRAGVKQRKWLNGSG